MKKNIVLILGKLPPPYMGPAIATQIILNSSLRNHFELLHVDTKANQTLDDLGKWSLGKIFRNLAIYFRLFGTIIRHRPALVLIPISQTSTGFIKDFFLIAISKITFRKVLVQLRKQLSRLVKQDIAVHALVCQGKFENHPGRDRAWKQPAPPFPGYFPGGEDICCSKRRQLPAGFYSKKE